MTVVEGPGATPTDGFEGPAVRRGKRKKQPHPFPRAFAAAEVAEHGQRAEVSAATRCGHSELGVGDMPRTGLEGAQRGQVTLEGLDTGRWRQSGNSPGRHNVNLSLKSAHGPNEWGGPHPYLRCSHGDKRTCPGGTRHHTEPLDFHTCGWNKFKNQRAPRAIETRGKTGNRIRPSGDPDVGGISHGFQITMNRKLSRVRSG